MRWTKAFRKAAGKEMTVDSTFEFEKRRNVPVRYDREMMETTVRAIKRVQEVRAKRERAFVRTRVQGKVQKEKEEAMKQVQTGTYLLKVPTIKKRQSVKVAAKPAQNRMEVD
jgi:large subunit ribosomal protein L24e